MHEPSIQSRALSEQAAQTGPDRSLWALAPLLLFLTAFLAVILAAAATGGGPDGKAFGGDFARFLSAGQVLKDGGNPYDRFLLHRTEVSLLARGQGIGVLPQAVPVGNPPLLYWALEPLLGLPFRAVALSWIAGMMFCSAVAVVLVARMQEWKLPLAALGLLVFPEIALGAYYGTVDALVFLAIVLGLVIGRTYPFVAGLLVSAVWIKPSAALPIAALILLFHVSKPLRSVAGFALGIAVLVAATLAVAGPAITADWAHTLLSYQGNRGTLGDLATLSGLYVGWAPSTLAAALEVLTVAIAAVVTAAVWRQHRDEPRPVPVADVAWLWAVWFLASPFGHLHDAVLLMIPTVALLGAAGISSWPSLITLYALALAVIFMVFALGGVQLSSLALIVVAATLWYGSRMRRKVVAA